MKSKLPPMAPRSARNMPGRQKDYSPTEWKEFYSEFQDVKVDEKSSFRVYKSKPADNPYAPVLCLLHGGGYNALTWSVFTVSFHSSTSTSFNYFGKHFLDRNHFNNSLPMFGD